MANTEFYATTGGSNLNGGSGGTAITREGWMSAADTFAGSSLDLSGVSVGSFAGVRPTGVSVSCRVARVTAVDDSADTITLSSTASLVSSSTSRVVNFVSGNGANNGTTISDLCGATISRDGTGSFTSTTQSKYGGSSIYCPGSYASGFRIAHSTSQQFGAGAFTLACWVRTSNKEKLANSCIHKYGASDGTRSWGFGIAPTSGASNRLWLTYSTNGLSGTQVDLFQAATIANDTWYHIALTRSGNTLYWFLDGSLLGTTAFSATIYSGTSDVCIGRYGTFSGSTTYDDMALVGYISGIMICNYAVWTATFTPPSSHVTATVGGSWATPSGDTSWPLDHTGLTALTDASSSVPRVNISGTTAITTAITLAQTTPIVVEGCTAIAGDGGHATFTTSGTNGGLVLSGTGVVARNLSLTSSATTGTGTGINITGASNSVEHCIVTGWRANGISMGSSGHNAIRGCEIATSGKDNSTRAGINGVSAINPTVEQCYVHDNTGTSVDGIRLGRGAVVKDCIIAGNGCNGIRIAATQDELSEFHGNIIDGNGVSGSGASNTAGVTIDSTSAAATIAMVDNVIINNAGYGVYGTGASKRRGTIRTTAFRGNGSGQFSGEDCMITRDNVTLTAAPYSGANYSQPSDEIVGHGSWAMEPETIASSRNIGPIYEEGSAGVFPVLGSAIIRVMGVSCA